MDPTNPNILYTGGAGATLFKFDGTTWIDVTDGLHADLHSLAWAGNRLIVGNDGGVWSTTNGGTSWTNHNTSLAITQFYEGSIHPTDPDFALGGSQDNGTEKWTGTDAWQWIFGGDGADNAISSGNPDTHWAVSFQNLGIVRTTNGGGSFITADSGINKTGVPFIAHFEKCPANDDVFIAGTDNLWKSTNFFSAGSPTWSSNSPELGSGLSALAFAASDSNCLTYVLGTTNGGSTWAHMGPESGLPNVAVFELQINDTSNRLVAFTHGRGAFTLEVSDTTSPTCELTNVDPGPPKRLFITAQDTGSGLKQINVLEQTNSIVSGNTGFTVGTTDPVVVTATKIDQSQASRVTLQVIDVDNNTITCDPVTTDVIRDPGKPVSQTYTGFPEEESIITIQNDTPGLTTLAIDVNHRRFQVGGLRDGEHRSIDVSTAMQEGDENTITLTGTGRPGGQASILISE